MPAEEESVWSVRISSIVGYEWQDFMKLIKVHLLSKSIHKGKFKGFLVNGRLLQGFDLSRECLESAGDIRLVIENMDLSYAEVVSVMESKKAVFENLVEMSSGEEILSFNMRVARELAYTSDKIEGTTIEEGEAKANLEHFRDELPEQQRDPDHIEMRNHMLTVVDLVFTMKDKPIQSINVDYILTLHRALDLFHMRPEYKGVFRDVDVTIATGPNPGFTRHTDVPRAVDAMLQQLHSMSCNTDTLHVAAWLHFQFVQIHPFADGNGRVGRLLMNTFLLQRGFPLVCIHPNIREIYFQSLKVARRIENGALSLPAGTSSPYDFLKRILVEFTVRSLDIGISMLSLHLQEGQEDVV